MKFGRPSALFGGVDAMTIDGTGPSAYTINNFDAKSAGIELNTLSVAPVKAAAVVPPAELDRTDVRVSTVALVMANSDVSLLPAPSSIVNGTPVSPTASAPSVMACASVRNPVTAALSVIVAALVPVAVNFKRSSKFHGARSFSGVSIEAWWVY